MFMIIADCDDGVAPTAGTCLISKDVGVTTQKKLNKHN